MPASVEGWDLCTRRVFAFARWKQTVRFYDLCLRDCKGDNRILQTLTTLKTRTCRLNDTRGFMTSTPQSSLSKFIKRSVVDSKTLIYTIHSASKSAAWIKNETLLPPYALSW